MKRRDEHDDPHDAHLLAALRHAPDRDALPPAEVSERILAAARAAVRPADQQTPRPTWRQRLGAWLAQPPAAAAFGTLAVVSLLGVMWSTREPPVREFAPNAALTDRAEQRAVAPPPAESRPAEVAKAEASDVPAAPAANSEPRTQVAAPPPPKPSAKDAAARPPSRSRVESETVAAPAANPSTTARSATANSSAPAAAAPPPAPQAADVAATPATPAAAPPPAIAAERRSADKSESQLLPRQQSAAAPRAASATALGMALAAKARTADPLAAVDAALAAGARWQASGVTGHRPHGDAQRAFWVSVKVATQGHWEAVPPLSPLAPWLTLEPASPGAILWVMNDALYITAQGQSWRAAVDAALLADWQAQVARW